MRALLSLILGISLGMAGLALSQQVNGIINVPTAAGIPPSILATGTGPSHPSNVPPYWTTTVLAAVPTGAAPLAVGNDLILGKNPVGVAPIGPGSGAIVIRARQGSIVATCKLVVAAGNSFGQEITIIDNIPGGTSGC